MGYLFFMILIITSPKNTFISRFCTEMSKGGVLAIECRYLLLHNCYDNTTKGILIR